MDDVLEAVAGADSHDGEVKRPVRAGAIGAKMRGVKAAPAVQETPAPEPAKEAVKPSAAEPLKLKEDENFWGGMPSKGGRFAEAARPVPAWVSALPTEISVMMMKIRDSEALSFVWKPVDVATVLGTGADPGAAVLLAVGPQTKSR